MEIALYIKNIFKKFITLFFNPIRRVTDFTELNWIPCLPALLMHVFQDNFEQDKSI